MKKRHCDNSIGQHRCLGAGGRPQGRGRKGDGMRRCHGPGGVSANPDWPSLAGQGQKYIEKQLKDFKSGERPNMVMQPQAGMLLTKTS